MSLMGSPQWGYATGDYYEYKIPYSCRFDGGASLTRNLDAPTDQDKFTLSVWLKRSIITSASEGKHAFFGITSTNNPIGFFALEENGFSYVDYGQGHSNYIVRARTGSVFRDPAAWYHVVYRIDQAQGTQSNRFRVYVNGVEQTIDTGVMGGSFLDMTQSYLATLNSDSYTSIIGGGGNYDKFNGYMAEMHFIDGQSLAPTSFGEAGDYGDWKPIEVESMTYGNNGFYLDFADSGALGDDESGNTNDYTVSNLVATDQMLDSPTNNFSTWHSIKTDEAQPAAVRGFEEGALKCTTTGNPYGAANGRIFGTMGVDSGKWYFEWVCTVDASTVGSAIGVANYDHSDEVAYYVDGTYRTDSSGPSYGATWGIGDIIGIAFNADTNAITFYKNGSSQGEITSAVDGSQYYFPFVWDGSGNPTITGVANFGQDSSFAAAKTAQGNQDSNDIGDFYYTPPSGFLAICAANLPAVAVKPSEHFGVIAYTANGGSQSLTGLGFKPDLVITKKRSGTAAPNWTDAVRGASIKIKSNGSDGNADQSSGNWGMYSFDSDGFSVKDDSGGNYEQNGASGATYVGWCWKASNAATVTNTAGTIDSEVSANTSAGFSILTYVGVDSQTTTVGHGLSKAPELVIVKAISENGRHWRVMGNVKYPTLDATDYLKLNTGDQFADDDNYWNDTAPTSTVFSVGDANDVNDTDCTFVAYCWHSVDGYSKVGSYVGNSALDGTFVYCGFRPKWVLMRSYSTSGDWLVFDSARNTTNVMDDYLDMDTSDAEASTSTTNYEIDIDFVSNGMKMRGRGGGINGNNHLFIAFAESPLKYANAK